MNHTPVDVPHSELQTVLTIFASPVTHSTRGPSKISRLSLNADTDRYCKLQNVHCKLSLDLKLFRNQFAICTCEFAIAIVVGLRSASQSAQIAASIGFLTVHPARQEHIVDRRLRPSGVPADVRFARAVPVSHNTPHPPKTAITQSILITRQETRASPLTPIVDRRLRPSGVPTDVRFARDAPVSHNTPHPPKTAIHNSYSSLDGKHERRR